MKSWLACFLLCLLGSVSSAQTPSFDQQRAASIATVLQKYPEAKITGSHLTRCADKIYLEWQAKNDWRLTDPNLPLFLWESADIQRQLEVRLAQIRATSYVTPSASPAPRHPSSPLPASTTTVIHSAGQGVYTTHGGAAGGATITQPVPGVWEVRSKDGTMQRLLKP